jgi:hypothetical protein
MEGAMSIGETMVLVLIISAFVTFGATLGWLSHLDRPTRVRTHRRIGTPSSPLPSR